MEKKIKIGDIVKILEKGGNYESYPGSKLVTGHASNKVKSGNTFRVLNIHSETNRQRAEYRLLGKVGAEFVSYDQRAVELIRSDIYKIH